MLVSSVPMREQKKRWEGVFFQAGQCAVLSSLGQEYAIFCRKGVCFSQVCENAMNRGLK